MTTDDLIKLILLDMKVELPGHVMECRDKILALIDAPEWDKAIRESGWEPYGASGGSGANKTVSYIRCEIVVTGTGSTVEIAQASLIKNITDHVVAALGETDDL